METRISRWRSEISRWRLRKHFGLHCSRCGRNKLRSVLTLLGVVIAVASVIAVVTLINGANMRVCGDEDR